MATHEMEELQVYARTLRAYSQHELEDVYFHIDVLSQPRRYQLVLREMEARRLSVEEPRAPRRVPDLARWLAERPCLTGHPVARGVLLAWLVCVATAASTLALLAPIWLFAVPLRFLGLQASLVYFACAPVPPIVGAGVGARVGGRGFYSVFVLLGIVAAFALFEVTGAPDAILRVFAEPQGTGGGTLGF